MNRSRQAIHIVGFLTLLLSQSSAYGEAGFGGIRKKSINIDVRQPATVRLTDTSIAFTGNVSNPEYASVLESLKTTMETEVISNEKSLVKKNDPKEADWTLFMSVTGYGVTQTNDAQGKISGWKGSLNVAYQVLDRTGRVHDADNLTQTYPLSDTSGVKRTLGGMFSSKSQSGGEEVKQALVHAMASQIGSNLGNSTISVPVQLAGGEDHLDRAGVFMSQKLWARASEELEATKPYVKPEEESYRLYALGLAYEGMSYEAKAYRDQRANMLRAAELYNQATEMNRKQDYFVKTVARIRDSITRYKILDDQQAKAAAAKPTVTARSSTSVVTPAAPSPSSPPQSTTPAGGGAKAHTAVEIIELFKQGVPAANILEIIASAPLEFDPVDIPTVRAITDAKVPISLQNEMRKKVGAALLPTTAAAKPAAKKNAAPKKAP